MRSTSPRKPESPHPPKSPERRVDVVVSGEEGGRRQVVIRDLSYAEGIGWYAQKSIRLDPEQVDALLGALCCARQGCTAGHGANESSATCPGSTGNVQRSPSPRIISLDRRLTRPR